MFCKLSKRVDVEERISYIFSTLTFSSAKFVKKKLRKLIASREAKKAYLILAMGLVMFFVCNDILLPAYVNSGGIIEVPSVIGKTYADAERTINALGLVARKGDVRMDREHPAGSVILQNPQEGSKVKRGRRIYLALSGGEILVEVPNLKGRTLRDAKYALEREGLMLGAIEYRSSDQFPVNTVIEQMTRAGSTVKHDAFVSVVVSQGITTEKIPVPDLYGKNLMEAEKLLNASSLRVGNVTYVPSPDLLPNTIIQQFPPAGELVINAQPVDLIIVQAGDKKKELFEN